MIRKVLHLDLDAFFCAVEEQRDPSLRGKAFAVGGRPDQRGVVASCSYPARQFRVHSALPMSQAVNRCPHLIIVPTTHGAYSAVSRKVMAKLRELTPHVEQLSIDEAFLDVSELAASSEQIARQLQATIRNELGLPCSLGGASNKLVAKIANNVGKAAGKLTTNGAAPPNAIQIVPPGREAEFLAPLPCDELWGVGPKTAERLHNMGIQTIGDIAAQPEALLAQRFGKMGAAISRHAKGIDPRPIVTERESKSVSKETTFSQDVHQRERLVATLQTLSEGVSRSLKRQELAGTTVRLKIRWPGFETPTRQLTLSDPTNEVKRIFDASVLLFDRIWPVGRPVRLMGVGVSGFSTNLADDGARQMSLWEVAEEIEAEAAKSEKEKRLELAVKALRERFGDDVLQSGKEVGQNET